MDVSAFAEASAFAKATADKTADKSADKRCSMLVVHLGTSDKGELYYILKVDFEVKDV